MFTRHAIKSSSSQPDESADGTAQEISEADEVTATLNALYATEDSSLEPHIEARGAVFKGVARLNARDGLREPCRQLDPVSLALLNAGLRKIFALEF